MIADTYTHSLNIIIIDTPKHPSFSIIIDNQATLLCKHFGPRPYIVETVLGVPSADDVGVVICVEVRVVQLLQLLQGRRAVCPGRWEGL